MHQFLKRFLADRSGNILIITGIGFLFLVGIGGAGYDLGKQQLVKQRIQQASDAAAVSAAGMSGASVADRTLMAQKIYDLNFPSTYLGVARPAPVITVTATDVRVSGSTNVSTAFVSNFNNGAGPVTLASAGSSKVLIKNNKIDFDLVVVVDESGSTAAGCASCVGSRMDTEKLAITSVLDIIFPAGPVNPDVRFGLIGYTQHVSNKWGLTSIKASAQNAVTFLQSRNANFDHYGLEAGYNMITGNTTVGTPNGTIPDFMVNAAYDNTPPAEYFNPAVFPFRSCFRSVSFTYGIPTAGDPCSTYLIPTAVKNTEVPPPVTARSDGMPVSLVKNVIFITDGFIMVEPDGCNYGPQFMLEPRTAGAVCPNYPKFLTECDNLKAAGVNLFVISFASQTAGDENTLKSCASIDPSNGNPRYYFAPSGTALNTILQSIAALITKVRIIE